MNGILVRRARPADLAALRRLWQQLDQLHARLQPEFFSPATRSVSADDFRRMLVAPDRCLLVAADEASGACDSRDGKIVGAAQIQIYETPANRMMVQARRGHVEEIIVDREHRRTGVGRALMAAATAWCLRRGAAHLLLTVWAGNPAAEGFYRALGYREVNRVLGRRLS